VQNYFYDLHDQLVKAEIFKKDGTKETWAYTYGRIGKGRLKDGEVSDGLEEETGFVWDGSHLLQEVQPDGRYTYIYTDPDSYEPLAGPTKTAKAASKPTISIATKSASREK